MAEQYELELQEIKTIERKTREGELTIGKSATFGNSQGISVKLIIAGDSDEILDKLSELNAAAIGGVIKCEIKGVQKKLGE